MAASKNQKGKRGTTGKTAKSTASRRKTTAKKHNVTSGFQTEIILLIILAASMILVISNFGLGGAVGDQISAVCFGIMGLLAYVFPVLLFVGAAFLMSNRKNPLAYKKTLAALVFFLFLCGFVQLLTEGYLPGTGFMDYYKRSSELHTGGGVIGGAICMSSTSAFGIVGGYIIIVLVLLITMILITQRSFFDFIFKIWDSIVSLVKGGHERYMEGQPERDLKKEIRDQERRQKRENRQEDLIRNNNTINWIPENIGKGRFGDWLENVQDWGISRNRYWGTPLNIWQCECGHMHSVGSRQELFEMSGDEKAKTVELHRPYIDEITLKCPECGGTMHRVPEVIDCWFDSGAMPFAQHHYPFENQDLFEQQFPADFISEAVDQTRGWFYSLLAESTLLFNKAPYRNVIVLGHVQDENGQKMSKSKGNAVDPFDALEKYGADAIRWYFYINSAPWLPNRFHGKAVVEGQRKFMSTLWNTYAFFVLYANIDEFDPTKYNLDYDSLPVMDKWLLSKLNSVVKAVDENLASYKIPESARALQEFVDEMSNWYVRRSRERFWAKGMEQDKINAYMTLYTALVTISKAAAPMIPFMTEDMYQNLVRSVDPSAPESIHLCDFPQVKEEWINKELEDDMEALLKVVVLGRAARNTANIKNRQPIGTMFVKAEKEMDQFYTDIIADELNVKEVKFAKDVESFISYSFKPQLRTVGPKYGKLLNGIRTALTELNGTEAMKELKETGLLTLDIDGNKVELAEEDLLIETAQTEGYVTETDGDTSVVLDTNLTSELIEEGFVREIISKIQTMRKEAGFEVMDKIHVYAKDNQCIMDIMENHRDEIMSEVLAEEITLNETDGYVKEWSINKENVVLGVTPESRRKKK